MKRLGIASVLCCLGLLASTPQIRQTALPPPPAGAIVGAVHDIFGDPVSRPHIRFSAFETTGDEAGRYALEGVPTGTYDVRIVAEGHRERAFTYTVVEGENSPRVKYETGMWPTEFAADFHVFFASADQEILYGVIGLANPYSSPIYVTALRVIGPEGTPAHDFFATPAQLQSFVLSYASLQLSWEPIPAMVLPARGYLNHIEMKPIRAPLTSEGDPYRLVVEYATAQEREEGRHRVVVKEALPTLEIDYNPHSP